METDRSARLEKRVSARLHAIPSIADDDDGVGELPTSMAATTATTKARGSTRVALGPLSTVDRMRDAREKRVAGGSRSTPLTQRALALFEGFEARKDAQARKEEAERRSNYRAEAAAHTAVLAYQRSQSVQQQPPPPESPTPLSSDAYMGISVGPSPASPLTQIGSGTGRQLLGAVGMQIQKEKWAQEATHALGSVSFPPPGSNNAGAGTYMRGGPSGVGSQLWRQAARPRHNQDAGGNEDPQTLVQTVSQSAQERAKADPLIVAYGADFDGSNVAHDRAQETINRLRNRISSASDGATGTGTGERTRDSVSTQTTRLTNSQRQAARAVAAATAATTSTPSATEAAKVDHVRMSVRSATTSVPLMRAADDKEHLKSWSNSKTQPKDAGHLASHASGAVAQMAINQRRRMRCADSRAHSDVSK